MIEPTRRAVLTTALGAGLLGGGGFAGVAPAQLAFLGHALAARSGPV